MLSRLGHTAHEHAFGLPEVHPLYTRHYAGTVDDEFQHRDELETIYVRPNDRYVVSLIVGYAHAEIHPAEPGAVPSPVAAAYSALSLTRDENSHGTLWSVHDRESGQTTLIRQADLTAFARRRPRPAANPRG